MNRIFKALFSKKTVVSIGWFVIIFIAFHGYIYLMIHFELNTPSQIKSYSDALWYALVTVTTVGYGDMYPHSAGGRVLAVILLFASVGLIGYLLGKLTNFVLTQKELKKMGNFGTEFKDHVIVLGWDEASKHIVKDIVNEGLNVAIITAHKNDIDEIHQEFSQDDVFVLYSSLSNYSYFSKANIEDSSAVVMSCLTDTEKLILSINLKAMYPKPRYIVNIEDPSLSDTFKNAGIENVICKNDIASFLTASYVFEPNAANFGIDLLGKISESDTTDIKQYTITNQNELCNVTYGVAFEQLKKRFNSVLIGIQKHGENSNTIIKMADDDVVIQELDNLVLITTRVKIADLDTFFGVKKGKISK